MTAKFLTRTELEKLIHENHESVRFVQKKKPISMSSTATVSSEDSACIMPKQSRIDDEDSYSTSDVIKMSFD